MTGQEFAIGAVVGERRAQDRKWGEQNHGPLVWLAVLSEEVGEASEAILKNDPDAFRAEMIQVAAVALAIVECADRHMLDHGTHAMVRWWRDAGDRMA